MNENVSILGCGWLGLPLAKKFIDRKYVVKGSTTSVAKLESLQAKKIQPFLIALTEEKVEGNIAEFLKETKTLIINIPPGLRKNPKENFVKKMKLLFTEVEKSEVRHIVYVSSTSVFEDEENIPTYTENNVPNANSSIAQQLIEVEKLWQSSEKFTTAIVRFGGLIGEDRHPVKYLAGRKNIQNPVALVNLIEQKDAINLLLRLVGSYSFGVFHGVYPQRLTRQAYYSAEAKKRGLESPIFDEVSVSKGKEINVEQTCLALDFQFEYKP